MSVNATWLLILGGIYFVTSFLTGRYFATLTPESAAKFKKGDRPAALKEFHLIGKVMMISAPVIPALFAWMALSGMVD